MNILKELRRRNVFRVAGVYAVVGWLLIQVVVAVKAPLHLPVWTDTFFVVLVLAGFPFALLFAWAFELTPEGVKLTKNVAEGESGSAKTGRKLDYAIIIGLALVAVLIFGEHFLPRARPVRTAASDTIQSVAVLPFVDMSPQQNEEYFSDGISEEILNVLARIPQMKVAGRTSSFEFKGKNEDLRKIGEALGVNHVLEGSVRKAGDTVRITAQLVKTEDGFHVWSETYDRKLTDIFEVQDEIARAVADQLALSLGLSKEELVPDRTQDVAAYERFLEAKQLIAKRGRENLERAALLLNEAAARDPNYAPAWSAMSTLYAVFEVYEPRETPDQTRRQWRAISQAAAERAIKINPNEAQAYILLSGLLLNDRNWIPAFDDFDKAMALAGDNAEVLNLGAQVLNTAGYWKNSKELSLKAIANDPLVGIYHSILGYALRQLGDDDGAIAELEKAVTLSPELRISYRSLIVFLVTEGRFDEALKRLPDAIERGYYDASQIDIVKALQSAWHDDAALKNFLNSENPALQYYSAVRLGDDAKVMDIVSASWDASVGADPPYAFAPRLVKKNPRWKAKIREIGLVDLWRQRGFPATCRPVGENDFECE